MALLLQDRKSTLRRPKQASDQCLRLFHLNHKTDVYAVNSLLLSHLHLTTVAWHTPSTGLSLAAACCSIGTCKKSKLSFKYATFNFSYT